MIKENYTENQKKLTQSIFEWVKNGITEKTVEEADRIGKFLANNKLTTSQIRNIFGEMRRIQMRGYEKEKSAFLLLKPKLAYAVKRNDNEGIKEFYRIFCDGFDAVDKMNDEKGKEHFNNFMQILEAILAFHKYYGGKE